MICPYCRNYLVKKWEGSFHGCSGCGILIRNETLGGNIIENIYKNGWADPYANVGETGGTSSTLARKYLIRLRKSLHIKSVSGLTILDYGAGRGEFTSVLQRDGADVYAVEPYGFDFLKKRHGNTYRLLEDINPGQLFHGIVSLNVIEHLTSPWRDLSELMALLIPGGWLFLTTPNSKGLNAIIKGAEWREAKRSGHLYLFNSLSLNRILSDCGFVNIQWLRWFLPYGDKLLTNIKDWILQRLRLDGELKFLAIKPRN